ncbi:MAG TPA: DNA translocase FtsK, partial [Gemmatimonadales bacterium]|nr:DNA translocase FtsK [Gemmatimonadales bacterium]
MSADSRRTFGKAPAGSPGTAQDRAFRDTQRRRLGAITALVLGVFIGLTFLPIPLTGPVGKYVGQGLWRMLGAGAIGIPLLGVGLALAGFDRLGKLDMKRAAILILGLSVLLPYLIGVVAGVSRTDLDLDERGLVASLVGWLPGFFSETISGKVGVLGAVLLGFLALSALTLATFAWHPLQRFERAEAAGQLGSGTGIERGGSDATQSANGTGFRPPVAAPSSPSPPLRPPTARKEKKPKPAGKPASAAGLDEESDLPPIDLLTAPSTQDIDAGEAQLDRLGESLIETLRTFKVEGRPGLRTTGPVVTQFEVVPAPGVKAGRIGALADDLAIAMRVPSVRVAPIPGKGAVGVEIPNPTARIVTLRELFESPDWENRRATLPIALGHDLEGKPVIADLAKMPHLLIAGATGTGKSVTINTIITSLIYRYTQKELRLL